jgi:hypothetical protein
VGDLNQSESESGALATPMKVPEHRPALQLTPIDKRTHSLFSTTLRSYFALFDDHLCFRVFYYLKVEFNVFTTLEVISTAVAPFM